MFEIVSRVPPYTGISAYELVIKVAVKVRTLIVNCVMYLLHRALDQSIPLISIIASNLKDGCN